LIGWSEKTDFRQDIESDKSEADDKGSRKLGPGSLLAAQWVAAVEVLKVSVWGSRFRYWIGQGCIFVSMIMAQDIVRG